MKYILVHLAARQGAMKAIAEAPDGYWVTIKPPSRNLEQNAKFHATCHELSVGFEWAGKKRSVDEWKSLLVSAHSRHLKQIFEVVCGIENEVVALRESTSAMSKERMSSLIDYSEAFLVQQQIEGHNAKSQTKEM
jgi:hypothetical protein